MKRNAGDFRVSRIRRKRLKDFNKEATNLGFIEKLSLRYSGKTDGRKGLIRYTEDGWQSAFLKQEVDCYEELYAKQMWELKLELEEDFKMIQDKLDQTLSSRKQLLMAKKCLNKACTRECDDQAKKTGEEKLSDVQVRVRRQRERKDFLQQYIVNVEEQELQYASAVRDTFSLLYYIQEKFDTAVKGMEWIMQKKKQRIDVYWRSAMCHMSELPPHPNVTFSRLSEQAFKDHIAALALRTEKLRSELAKETDLETI